MDYENFKESFTEALQEDLYGKGIEARFDMKSVEKCIFRLNGTASPRQRKGCPLQTGSLLLVNSGYACSFHSVQGGTPYE